MSRSSFLPVGCISTKAIKRKRRRWMQLLADEEKIKVEHIKNFHYTHIRFAKTIGDFQLIRSNQKKKFAAVYFKNLRRMVARLARNHDNLFR